MSEPFITGENTGSGTDYDIVLSTRRPASRQMLDKAERLYREAVRLYEEGKTGKARECFNTALQTLQYADNDAHVYYQMKNEMDNLFRGLRWLVSGHTESDNTLDNRQYTIPMTVENKLVEKYMALFSQGKPSARIRKALSISGKYRKMILTILNEYDLPRELVYLPIIESLYNLNDCSSRGAVGIWQLMPERARALGLKVNYWIDERKDPEKSTVAAARYLKYLHLMFDDWHLALAAYNRGEFGLARDIEAAKAVTINQISNRNATPDETEYFVPQFIACTLVCDRAFSSGNAPALEEPEDFDEVIINEIVDIGIIATCAGTNSWRIRQLNPALRSWCTPPNYPNFKLRIPHGTKKKFIAALAAVPDRNPSPGYIKYVVAKGECVNDIAKKFQTSVWSIKKANRLVNIKNIKTGETLMVRPGKEYFTR
ncbi:MAG: hypothetical protein A2293_16265 [Elusimicrobia bacterium RIFOXYB2_FULL_49_7]|nr:MAG: hypothetical protein A2293_16265 [Elusimicrobia bacterium RIFOXYB2_FULL_49_7]